MIQDSISFYFREPDTVWLKICRLSILFHVLYRKIYLLAENAYSVDTTRIDACSWSANKKDIPAGKCLQPVNIVLSTTINR